MSAVRRVIQVGVDHRTVSLDVLARLHSLRRTSGGDPDLGPDQGCVALATCHRLELFLENVPVCHAKRFYWTWLTGEAEPPEGIDLTLTIRRGEEAARHLMTVTAGLQSAVLGEDQILMQVRKAYRAACDASRASALLHRMFHTAFRTGKRVRSQTEVGSGGRSLSGAAVRVLQAELEDLSSARVLVLGLGEMGELAACRLRKRGAGELILCNRTREKADQLARHLDARVLAWEWRAAGLDGVDAVICATGADTLVVSDEELRRAVCGRETPLLAIDLAVPRNLPADVAGDPGLELLDVERLTERLAGQEEQRRCAIERAEEIVDTELGEWLSWVAAREDHAPEAPGTCRRRRQQAG